MAQPSPNEPSSDQPSSDPYRSSEIRAEQEYLSELYGHLDERWRRTGDRLSEIQGRGGRGTMQALVERDAAEQESSRGLSRLSAADYGLCFGRLDLRSGDRRYIGRIGLLDDSLEAVLVDWRAPAAEGFYQATASCPGEVLRRRQIHTRGRRVVGIDDEVFADAQTLSDSERSLLDGESALFASLNAGRTGRMRDIVATIQAEQDRIIRAELPGILVVQGGPGTGKTVVALHRAAYLLYTYRSRLVKQGVLIIGPNPTFMRYIDQVLPALGENDVLLQSLGQLYPGVDADAPESPAAASVKGDLRMVEVLARAVRDRQRMPAEPLRITINRGTMYEEVVRLDLPMCEQAFARAWEAHEPHNQAREVFIDEIIESLRRRVMGRMGSRRVGSDGADDTGGLLRSDPDVAAAIESMWPGLRPQQFLADLFGSAARLATAGAWLTPAEQAVLRREPTSRSWSAGDVPLLDEVAELLGPLRSVQDILGEQVLVEELDDELAYAGQTLKELGIETVNAEQLLIQHEGEALVESTAERARADRTWTFGHVIVDEAQELSPMVWRMLMRRCPSRSMTVVGDIAQTGSVAGARSWAAVLDPYARGRWQLEPLSHNYRSTTQIMDVAADVLQALDPGLIAPQAIRNGRSTPWSRPLAGEDLLQVLPELVKAELAALDDDGRLAIIAPAGRIPQLTGLLDRIDALTFADDPQALEAPTVVLTPARSKGLEFDAVLVLEPQEILDDSDTGISDLYVAVTRATQRMGLLHSGPLPAMLSRAGPVPAESAVLVNRSVRPERR